METNHESKQQTIAILGANGGTGKCCMEQALKAGYNVVAIVRTPSKITLTHPNLKVVKGDVMEVGSFEEHLNGVHAIISALGIPASQMSPSSPPITLYSEGNRNILRAMENYGISRIFAMSASAVEISPKNPFIVRLITKLFVQRVYGRSYEDQLVMEAMFKQSNVNWTVVRPPKLTDRIATGKYRYAISSFLKNCFSISRADVAHFMITHMEDAATYKSIVEVAY